MTASEKATVEALLGTPVKKYVVNEIFYSPQGEGHRTGTMNVFVRFAGCNLQCVDGATLGREIRGIEVNAGFNCDTDFRKGTKYTLRELVEEIKKADRGPCKSIIFTGGEPALQLDEDLLLHLKTLGYHLAIETNGTIALPRGLDWISCSPKKNGPPIVIHGVNEYRVVVKAHEDPMAILAPIMPPGNGKSHFFVSPAAAAPTVDKISGFRSSSLDFSQENMAWAVEWCSFHPQWRISLQIHKILGVR